MKSDPETIFIIDDDESVRMSLSVFLASYDHRVESFSSSETFLSREAYHGTGCLILDVNLAGKSGLELQEELLAMNSYLPIIFISGCGNIQMSVKALKNGGINFLEKPFEQEELLQSIDEALVLSRRLKRENEEGLEACHLINKLSPRESEILKYIISGMLNKQIASDLDIAEQTVKIHRHSICAKLGVNSVPEIIRIADKAGVVPVGIKNQSL
jgi:FixJ family two-component response regulator